MRRAILAVAIGVMAAWCGTCLAATDMDVATASLTIDSSVDLLVYWQSTGNHERDFGYVSAGSYLQDVLWLQVYHNLGWGTFSVQGMVNQTYGSTWYSYAQLGFNGEYPTWPPFGSPYGYMNTVSGASPLYQPLDVYLYVDPSQPAGSYGFEFDVTVTSW